MKAIISADYHLRPDCPRCRLDEDWKITQMATLRQIIRYANDYNVPLCIIGDLFHPRSGKVPQWLENMVLKQFARAKQGVHILAGNHDLPWHSWENLQESSFGVIWNSGWVRSLCDLGQAAHFGQEIEGEANCILFLHAMVFLTANEIPPNVEAKTAKELLSEYPQARWIFTGDMHKAFHYEKDGRHVVNPGCILRQASDFKDYQPQVYLVDTKTEEVISLPLEDKIEMVTDIYIKEDNARKERISAFVKAMKASGTVSLDFKANLESGMNKLDNETANMVNELLMEVE